MGKLVDSVRALVDSMEREEKATKANAVGDAQKARNDQQAAFEQFKATFFDSGKWDTLDKMVGFLIQKFF